jgi:hypothetical protein
MAALTRECVELALLRHHLDAGAIALEAHDEHLIVSPPRRRDQ